MIQVMHNGKLVSLINYGWESVAFYENWMPNMHGASIDIASPDLVSRDGMLALFNALLNNKWVAKFKRHYAEVKSAMSKRAK